MENEGTKRAIVVAASFQLALQEIAAFGSPHLRKDGNGEIERDSLRREVGLTARRWREAVEAGIDQAREQAAHDRILAQSAHPLPSS